MDTQTLTYEQLLAVYSAATVWTRDIDEDEQSLQDIVNSTTGYQLGDVLDGVGLGLEVAHNAVSGSDQQIFDGVYLVDYESDDTEGEYYYLAKIENLDELQDTLMGNFYFMNGDQFERYVELPSEAKQAEVLSQLA